MATKQTIRRFPALKQAQEAPELRGLYDIAGAAAYLSCSTAQVERWRRAGLLPGLLLTCRMRRWSRQELDAFAASFAKDGGEGRRSA